MKRTMKCESKRCRRGVLLSLLCAGVVAVFITGCAEAPPMTAYDQGYWYPTGSYWRDYDGNYQAYPFSDAPNGPRYRIVDGMHVYEPYYYGGAYATVGVPTE
ncbi:MAG: hypothetical protein DMC59_02975 [Verrucomicrobia bacterium]|nr:MAG: hypothetical protein DMC59_02975 [Verrucomicrobiota bacterium]